MDFPIQRANSTRFVFVSGTVEETTLRFEVLFAILVGAFEKPDSYSG